MAAIFALSVSAMFDSVTMIYFHTLRVLTVAASRYFVSFTLLIQIRTAVPLQHLAVCYKNVPDLWTVVGP